MSSYLINGSLTPADKQTIKDNLDANKVLIDPFAVNLNPAERRAGQHLGPNSINFVQGALLTGNEHPEIIPGDLDWDHFKKLNALFLDLTEIKNHGNVYNELIDDTIMEAGNEIMDIANRVYKQVKLSAKQDTALNEVEKELKKRYAKQGTKKVRTMMSLAMGGTIELSGFVLGTLIVNRGTTVFKFKAGSEIMGKPKSMDITVEPGDSAIIPKEWTVIDVTNLSLTAEGSFSVMMK